MNVALAKQCGAGQNAHHFDKFCNCVKNAAVSAQASWIVIAATIIIAVTTQNL